MTNQVHFENTLSSDRAPIGTYTFILQDKKAKKGVVLDYTVENSVHPEYLVHLSNKLAEDAGLDPKFTSGVVSGPKGFTLQFFDEGVTKEEVKRQVRYAARGWTHSTTK